MYRIVCGKAAPTTPAVVHLGCSSASPPSILLGRQQKTYGPGFGPFLKFSAKNLRQAHCVHCVTPKSQNWFSDQVRTFGDGGPCGKYSRHFQIKYEYFVNNSRLFGRFLLLGGSGHKKIDRLPQYSLKFDRGYCGKPSKKKTAASRTACGCLLDFPWGGACALSHSKSRLFNDRIFPSVVLFGRFSPTYFAVKSFSWILHQI